MWAPSTRTSSSRAWDQAAEEREAGGERVVGGERSEAVKVPAQNYPYHNLIIS